MRPKGAVLLAACLLALAGFLPAAEAVLVAAAPGGTQSGYATPLAVHPQGQQLVFANLDIDPHDVRSDDTRPGDSAPWCIFFLEGQCPLFYSDFAGQGETAVVYGAEGLSPGEYSFYCSIHPWMTGGLSVV